MRKLTAAEMTTDLPLDIPRTSRRLTKRERQLLCRMISLAWGCEATPLSATDFVNLAQIQGKLAPQKRRRGR